MVKTSTTRKAKTATKEAPATDAATTAPKDEETPRPACMCGCGVSPRGKKAKFRPGHDARLRGILLRARTAQDDDATDFEREQSAVEIANVPDIKWATKWHTTKHEGK